MIDKNEVLKLFPAPKFRKYQRNTIVRMVDAFNSGVKVVMLDAPTGFGKSIVNTTLGYAMAPSFYVTPQLSLIDQLRRDKYVGKYLTEVKGRQNYKCVYDPYATCDVGVCHRTKDFKCDKINVCPYWKAKVNALNSKVALMSFAYFMLEHYSETPYSFGKRRMLILDESHSLDMYVLNYINIIISPWSMPADVYMSISRRIRDFNSIYELRAFMAVVLEVTKDKYNVYEQIISGGGELSTKDVNDMNKASNIIRNIELFFESSESVEWVWEVTFTKYKGKQCKRLVLTPVYARFFEPDMIWNRADYFITSTMNSNIITFFIP